jgi:hypothetical protein
MVESVLTTIAVMAENPAATEQEIVLRLTEKGYDEFQAEKLVAFVPIAIARAIIERLGANPPIELSETALITDRATDRSVRLMDIPEFVTARRLAEETFSSGMIPGDELGAASDFSVEMYLINQVLNSGKSIDGAVLSPPILLRLADSPEFEEWYRSIGG